MKILAVFIQVLLIRQYFLSANNQNLAVQLHLEELNLAVQLHMQAEVRSVVLQHPPPAQAVSPADAVTVVNNENNKENKNDSLAGVVFVIVKRILKCYDY